MRIAIPNDSFHSPSSIDNFVPQSPWLFFYKIKKIYNFIIKIIYNLYMPAARNVRGQFVRDDLAINLPGFTGLYKILIIAVLIFPWYVILSNRNFATTLFGYIIGKNFSGCPQCDCPKGEGCLSQSEFQETVNEIKRGKCNCTPCAACPPCKQDKFS